MEPKTGALKTIQEQRKHTFAESRKLMHKTDKTGRREAQEPLSNQPVSVEVPKEPASEYLECECCGRADVPKENLAKIDSGQLLCPQCLKELREAQ